jgi:undecaprenyl-diphosphatase
VSVLQVLVLAVAQGVTELLPISSSAHLILIPKLFGWSEHPLVFDTTLHLGTAFALLIYFRKEIRAVIKNLISDLLREKLNFGKYSESGWLGIKILIGSFPAGIIGLLFGGVIENQFRGVGSVLAFLIIGSLLMLVADVYSKPVTENISEVSPKKNFLIGIFQSLALFSGISRSGATISGGMLQGLKRDLAAKLSFLLSIPIVLSAGIFEGISSFGSLSSISPLTIFLGFMCSLLSGLLAVKFLMTFLGTHKLTGFIIYRLTLVLLIIFSLVT